MSLRPDPRRAWRSMVRAKWPLLAVAILAVVVVVAAFGPWLAPLWWGTPLYRRRPLEFLHRWLRVARMAWITGAAPPVPRLRPAPPLAQ